MIKLYVNKSYIYTVILIFSIFTISCKNKELTTDNIEFIEGFNNNPNQSNSNNIFIDSTQNVKIKKNETDLTSELLKRREIIDNLRINLLDLHKEIYNFIRNQEGFYEIIPSKSSNNCLSPPNSLKVIEID
jgi:hypothetical protein